MKLWLLRHGQAEALAASDSQRALTESGRDEVRRSAMQLLNDPPQVVLVSPYLRAQQTAALVLDVIGSVAQRTVPWLTPDSDPRQVLNELDRYAQSGILLVAHQPLLGDLGGLLVHGHRQQPLPLRTASLVELQGEHVLAGGMQLLAVHSP
ncbi:phosphohistidine phosphatase SixA [Pseudomonas mangrovi]|uniref:Phosphohistidine phosphatase SixA n=1 Tax=Pseudomonas mangrovi TaxID=2161748 RepID=A0A2T5P771_9PSED|nr:phosphohistidine phosphatase SixA [Pseudomonas mangrovi]PTU73612.1 phosphohistidine phosphatase SixA [Pseudomonas mangrovi]